MNSDDDYQVGYGKPPKNSQFKEGQSGNPKGSSKGVRNFQTEVKDILRSKVIVTEAGKPKSVSTVKAALLRLKEKALKGDQRALEQLLAYAEESSSASDARTSERKLNKLEQEILDQFVFVAEAEDPELRDDE